MTCDEFWQQYADNSNMTVERLKALGGHAEPCTCGDEMCEGWRMEHHNVGSKGWAINRMLYGLYR